ncbi:MAG TPA: hypothetical protein VGB67_11150 [Fibrella sp.]|jgi:hypothetical protein
MERIRYGLLAIGKDKYKAVQVPEYSSIRQREIAYNATGEKNYVELALYNGDDKGNCVGNGNFEDGVSDIVMPLSDTFRLTYGVVELDPRIKLINTKFDIEQSQLLESFIKLRTK